MTNGNKCIVCGKPSPDPISDTPSDRYLLKCPNCGDFILSRTAYQCLPSKLTKAPGNGAILSHAIWKMHADTPEPELSTSTIDAILAACSVPRPSEQFDNLILFLGDYPNGMGARVNLMPDIHSAKMGAANEEQFLAILKELACSKYVATDRNNPRERVRSAKQIDCELTLAGWNYYESLKRSVADSRLAFMAMKFGDAQLNDLYDNHFKPAVSLTRFELRRLSDGAPAGLIDARMEVEIRKSRFVVADLTYGNNGVYWEAGFATALGKPVIYTCRNDMTKDIHFDTSHRQYIPWDPQNLSKACDDLKATIRATLPTEAKMED